MVLSSRSPMLNPVESKRADRVTRWATSVGSSFILSTWFSFNVCFISLNIHIVFGIKILSGCCDTPAHTLPRESLVRDSTTQHGWWRLSSVGPRFNHQEFIPFGG